MVRLWIGGCVSCRWPDPLNYVTMRQVQRIMAEHPNAIAPHLEWTERVPVLSLQWRDGELARHGLTPAAVAQQLNLLLDGQRILS